METVAQDSKIGGSDSLRVDQASTRDVQVTSSSLGPRQKSTFAK